MVYNTLNDRKQNGIGFYLFDTPSPALSRVGSSPAAAGEEWNGGPNEIEESFTG